MNEKKNSKIKICFPKDHEVLWDMLLPRNIPKKNYKKLFFFEHFLIFYLLYICIIF